MSLRKKFFTSIAVIGLVLTVMAVGTSAILFNSAVDNHYDAMHEELGPEAKEALDIVFQDSNRTKARYLMYIGLTVSFGMFAICTGLGVVLDRSVVKPLKQVVDATNRYVDDRRALDAKMGKARTKTENAEEAEPSAISKLSIHTGDELENLASAIQTMEKEINDYIRDLTAITAEKERIGTELGMAKHIQAAMLPSIFPPFPGRREFDIYATMNPAKEVGGDFYDFYLVDPDHLAVTIADVSGKGVPAALFMMISKTLIKTVAQRGLSPREVLETVNNQLCEGNDKAMFVTVWIGVLEISTGRLTCASAGHEYPTLRRKGGQYDLVHDLHGIVLGGFKDARYREYTIDLQPGDSLFVYTDGIPEATDRENRFFGTDRMVQALNDNTNDDTTSNELLLRVQTALDNFIDGAPQFDDVTMLALKYK